jgi:hypothetical protein
MDDSLGVCKKIQRRRLVKQLNKFCVILLKVYNVCYYKYSIGAGKQNQDGT